MYAIPGTPFYAHVTRIVVDIHDAKVSQETISILPTVILLDRTGAQIGTLAVDRISADDKQTAASSVAGMIARAVQQLESRLAHSYTSVSKGERKSR